MNKLIKFLSSSLAKNLAIVICVVLVSFFFIRSCSLSGDIRDINKKKEIAEAVHNKVVSELQGAVDSYSSSAAVAMVERDKAMVELKALKEKGPVIQTVVITKEKPIDGELWVPKVDFNLANKCCEDNAFIIAKQDEVISNDATVEHNLLGEIGALKKIVSSDAEYIGVLNSSYNKMKRLASRKIRLGVGGGLFATYKDGNIVFGPSLGIGLFKEL